jgi:hypothetical protein
MNQIQEKDWAEDSWHGHTGMDSSSDYCTGGEIGESPKDEPEAADKKNIGRERDSSSQSAGSE